MVEENYLYVLLKTKPDLEDTLLYVYLKTLTSMWYPDTVLR